MGQGPNSHKIHSNKQNPKKPVHISMLSCYSFYLYVADCPDSNTKEAWKEHQISMDAIKTLEVDSLYSWGNNKASVNTVLIFKVDSQFALLATYPHIVSMYCIHLITRKMQSRIISVIYVQPSNIDILNLVCKQPRSLNFVPKMTGGNNTSKNKREILSVTCGSK